MLEPQFSAALCYFFLSDTNFRHTTRNKKKHKKGEKENTKKQQHKTVNRIRPDGVLHRFRPGSAVCVHARVSDWKEKERKECLKHSAKICIIYEDMV